MATGEKPVSNSREIRFELDGIHLSMYEQLLVICNKFDNCDKLDHHTLARALIMTMLEEEAAANQDAVQ